MRETPSLLIAVLGTSFVAALAAALGGMMAPYRPRWAPWLAAVAGALVAVAVCALAYHAAWVDFRRSLP